MKMTLNKLINYSFSLIIAGTFMTSCDKVDEPFTKKVFFDTTQVEHQKRVLLEDYTGHLCVNCPTAALIAEKLKNNYGNKLVLLSIHAGPFANAPGGSFADDFTTEAGDAWDTYFGISTSGNPKGMVNRTGYPILDHILTPDKWSSAVSKALKESAKVDLEITNSYDADTRNLSSTIDIEFVETIDENLKLIVVLCESGIIAPQKNNDETIGPSPIIIDYVHNNMLRASITTGTWGVPIAEEGTANPETLQKSFNYVLNSEFNADKCKVVAFIYDTETNEVLQVAEKAVK